jgi:hypothetical protein
VYPLSSIPALTKSRDWVDELSKKIGNYPLSSHRTVAIDHKFSRQVGAIENQHMNVIATADWKRAQ